MIPEGWDVKKANAALGKIAREARAHFAGTNHDGNDIDDYIAEKWHEVCGVEWKKPERGQLSQEMVAQFNVKGAIEGPPPSFVDPNPPATMPVRETAHKSTRK